MWKITRPPEDATFAAKRSEWLSNLDPRAKTKDCKSEYFTSHWSDYKFTFSNKQEQWKCAYCESLHLVLRNLDIEHIRPKAKITEWIGKPLSELLYPEYKESGVDRRRKDLMPQENTKTEQVPGYWWIAYQWSNYLLACKDCNGWKRNLFPVLSHNTRRTFHNDHFNEGALLLDPTDPNFAPNRHFTWLETGVVSPLDSRAEATIIACGLNRHTLKEARLKVVRKLNDRTTELRNAIQRDNRQAGKLAYHQLRDLTQESSEFTAMTRFLTEKLFRELRFDCALPWE